ncbi:MAG: threonine/serine exporter family protein [Sandaracinus sp.]|nr:threonine/serine exporter family protein [Sandaracinus sp.]
MTPATEFRARSKHASHNFLLRLAELLHHYGTPAFRLERVLIKVASSLGVEGEFLSTPTSVMVSLGVGTDKEMHLVRGNSGEVNLGKLVEFDEVMEDVEHHRIDVEEASARLERIEARGTGYPFVLTVLAFGVASAGAARFFGGGLAELGVTFLLSVGALMLGRVLTRRADTVDLFEPMAAFLVAFASLGLAHVPGLEFNEKTVTLASLIVFLPGLTLTTALNELATRHLVSGVSRLAGSFAIFLTLLFGVALGWRVGIECFGPGFTSTLHGLPPWTLWATAAIAPFAFGVLLDARPRELPVIFLAGFIGFLGVTLGARVVGSDLAPFLGALLVGLVSNTYARISNRPAIVPMTPGIFMLVPGSFGFRSLTSFLERDALVGIDFAFQTGLVAISLVGGLLAANVVMPPRRVM